MENVLSYYCNLGSLRFGNEYCIEILTLSMGKTLFFSLFNWSLFQSHIYTARDWCRIKNEQMHGGGRGVWLYNQLPATASQISLKEATEHAAHSTARNAVLVPISPLRTKGRRSVCPRTALPNPCWKHLSWQPSFCAPCLGSRLALARRGPSNGPGLIHRPKSPLRGEAKPLMKPSASARTGWVAYEADPTEVLAKPLT